MMASFVKPTWSFFVLVLLDAVLVSCTWFFSGHSHSVLVLMAALLKLPLSFIVVLVASFMKPTWTFNVLLLLDAAWSFSVLSRSVLVLMVALLKPPLSLIVVDLIASSPGPLIH
jgi:hypothetical protein